MTEKTDWREEEEFHYFDQSASFKKVHPSPDCDKPCYVIWPW